LKNTVNWDKKKYGNPCGVKFILPGFDSVRELKKVEVHKRASGEGVFALI
jgi:hypothetical protein